MERLLINFIWESSEIFDGFPYRTVTNILLKEELQNVKQNKILCRCGGNPGKIYN